MSAIITDDCSVYLPVIDRLQRKDGSHAMAFSKQHRSKHYKYRQETSEVQTVEPR